MFRRVGWEVARVERQFSSSREVQETAQTFIYIMEALEFLPNSPTLMNAGLPNGQLSACFVLPLADSIESIFRTLRDMALIQKSSGGILLGLPYDSPDAAKWAL
jgi:ribonucleoside-diphosphate reductase alpha chain